MIYPHVGRVGRIWMSYLGNACERCKRASYGFISFLVIPEKIVHLFRRRRQAGQAECRTPQ